MVSGIRNKVVGAVCRRRPCQPRKLKSARAFRYQKFWLGSAPQNVTQFTKAGEKMLVFTAAQPCDFARLCWADLIACALVRIERFRIVGVEESEERALA